MTRPRPRRRAGVSSRSVARVATSDDWPYLLAQQILDAAVSCGATCARRFVTDSPVVEAPPPGCPCQLVAVVTEGFERPEGAAAKCSWLPVISVRLVLDLCVPVPDADRGLDPTVEATAARETSRIRWAMLRGIRTAASRGELHGPTWDPDDPMPPGAGGCTDVRPGAWTATVREGGMARWESTWRIY